MQTGSACGVRVRNGQRRHVHDAAHRGAGGQHMHGLGGAQQHGADGNAAAGGLLEQVVADVGGIDYKRARGRFALH